MDQGPESSAFLINIHEPIIWRLHEMIQQVNLSRLQDTQTNVVSVDPIIEIGYARNFLELLFKLLYFSTYSFLYMLLLEIVLNSVCLTHSVLSISEVRLKVSMAMSPSQRPRGVLGFWASLMTALGNTENMPVSVTVLLFLGFLISLGFLNSRYYILFILSYC